MVWKVPYFRPNQVLVLSLYKEYGGTDMHTIEDGYRAIGLLIDINWDRFFFPAAILVGLMAGAFVGSFVGHL